MNARMMWAVQVKDPTVSELVQSERKVNNPKCFFASLCHVYLTIL